MDNFGKSIKIFLADGKTNGFKHVEITNWSAQALSFSRKRLSELSEWEEAHKSGVYMLFEKIAFNEQNSVYIGESENVAKRLLEHDRNKDFWNEAIVFTSKDENLTKGHIQYLESRIIALVKECDRYSINNTNYPIKINLPKSEKAAMEEFIHNMKIILGSLGHQLIEKIEDNSSAIDEGELFVLKKLKKIVAEGKLQDNGFLVKRGALITKVAKAYLHNGDIKRRENILNSNQVVDNGEYWLLQEDVLFSSPSGAAAFIKGQPVNGLLEWKNKEGESIKDLENKKIGK